MSAAIHTKYINSGRGGRIRAKTKDGHGEMALSVPYAFELYSAQRHPAAAKALAEKLGWSGLWIVGHNDDDSICAVRVPWTASRAMMEMRVEAIEGIHWFFVEAKP
jgi:hypothetical protein